MIIFTYVLCGSLIVVSTINYFLTKNRDREFKELQDRITELEHALENV